MSFRISLVLKAFAVAAFTFVSCLRSDDTTLAGWTFSQFLGEGAPQINAETFESTGSIVATYGGNINPVSADVDGTVVIQSGGTGYTNPSIGTWSFGAFDINNADDVRADTFGALNTINSTTLDGKQMHLTDSAGMMLTFRKTTILWNIQVANTAGYTNASANDFTFAARGNDGAATVEWFFNDQLFSTTTVTAGSFNVYSAELPSQFYGNGSIQGRLVSGKVSFDNVQINGQRGNPPQFTQQPVSLVKVVGQSATFSVNVSGATEPTYQWFKGAVEIPGAKSSSYTILSVSLEDTAAYRVNVRSSNGLSAESDIATLDVWQAPSITRAPAPQPSSPGQTITFSVAASGTPKPDFRWQRNGVDLVDGDRFSGVTTDTLKISGVVDADAGDYRVVVSNIVDSVSSATAQLTVSSLAIAPTVTSDPIDFVAVQGGRAEFFVIASGAPSPSYRWQFNGAHLVDGPGISGASTDRLILEGLSPSRAGTYSVIIENSEGFVKREADLTVQVPPSIISGPGPESRFVAAGSEVVYSVSVGGDPLPSIQWLRNGDPLEGRTLSSLTLPSVTVIDEAVYSVRLTNAAGSIVSSGSELKVGSGARIISSPRSSIEAIGESVTFTVVADGNPLPAFQWFRNGNALPESYGSDSSLTLSNLSSADAGIYTVQVYNQFGTVTSESAELRVAQPVSVTRPNQVQTFAPGSTLVFGSPGTPSNPLRYEWYRDGKRLGGANDSELSLASASFSDSGVYLVKIFNSKGKLVASRVVARVSISVANGFDVLLRDTISGSPSGIVRLDVSRTGSFTGRLQLLDGSLNSFRGALQFTDKFISGQASVEILSKGSSPLTLSFDLDPNLAQLGSSLGAAGEVKANGSADRRFKGTAPWRGVYSLDLSSTGSAVSVLDATIANTGTLRVSGILADGSRLSFSSPSDIVASFPILVLPYRKGTGYLAGELGLEKSTNGFFADESTSGLWIWRRPSNGSSLISEMSPKLSPKAP